jgi:hypothetical protein
MLSSCRCCRRSLWLALSSLHPCFRARAVGPNAFSERAKPIHFGKPNPRMGSLFGAPVGGMVSCLTTQIGFGSSNESPRWRFWGTKSAQEPSQLNLGPSMEKKHDFQINFMTGRRNRMVNSGMTDFKCATTIPPIWVDFWILFGVTKQALVLYLHCCNHP